MLYRIIEPYRRGDLGLDSKAKEKRSQAVQKVLVVVQSTSVLSDIKFEVQQRWSGDIAFLRSAEAKTFARSAI